MGEDTTRVTPAQSSSAPVAASNPLAAKSSIDGGESDRAWDDRTSWMSRICSYKKGLVDAKEKKGENSWSRFLCTVLLVAFKSKNPKELGATGETIGGVGKEDDSDPTAGRWTTN
jgi:hypothetical protein